MGIFDSIIDGVKGIFGLRHGGIVPRGSVIHGVPVRVAIRKPVVHRKRKPAAKKARAKKRK